MSITVPRAEMLAVAKLKAAGVTGYSLGWDQ